MIKSLRLVKNISIIVGCLASFNSIPVYGQNHVDKYFDAVQKRQNTSLEKEVQFLLQERVSWLSLVPYQKDSIANIRYQAYLLTARLGQKSTKQEDREWAVEQLLGGNRSNDRGVRGVVIRELMSFYREDFSPRLRDTLRSSFNQKPTQYDSWVKLVGYIGLKDQISVIQSHIQGNQLSRSEKWAAYLALARLGDESALQMVMSRISKLPLNDDVVYEVMPDLIYTRQRVAIRYLVDALYNDDTSCQSADAETTKPITCAYRIMELLAPVIKGYPLNVEVTGDVVATDYPKALVKVRQWFEARKDNFEILDNTL